MGIYQACFWKEKQQMAEELKIGTGYMPANGQFSSSNLHIHKERRMLTSTVFVDADNHGYK